MAVAVAALATAVGSCGDLRELRRPVAVVDGKAISYGELLRELEKRQGATVLMGLIDEQLVRDEALKRNITLSENERQAGLERAAARVGSMADLESKLQRAGIPLEAYKHRIETDLLLDKIAAQEVKVSDAEVAAYYEEHKQEYRRGERVRARMMLFTDKASAEAVLEALGTPGASFEGLAKSLSQDAGTREAGGDMGWFEKGDYAAPITEAAFRLKPGETSGVIEVPDGWVILRVEGRRKAGPLDLDEVKQSITERLRYERQQQMRETWLKQARKAAALSILDDELRRGVEALLDVVKPPPMPGEL